MVSRNVDLESADEHLLAELAEAAYRVALRYGLKGPFIDVELDLWRALRVVLAQHEEAGAWR